MKLYSQLIILLLLAVPAHLFARQSSGPPGGAATVTTNKRCYRLVKDEFIATAPPGQGGTIQQVSEPIVGSVTISDPDIVVDSYLWSGPFDFRGSKTSPSVTCYMHSPGSGRLALTIDYHLASNPNQASTILAISKTIYCVGGPIQYGVSGGANGTPTRYPSGTSAPGQAYAQYFTVDPAQPIPAGWQTPQSITAAAAGNQPGTITLSWVLDPSVVRIDQGTASASVITLGAKSVGMGKKVTLTYHFSNGDSSDPVSMDIVDDSDMRLYCDVNDHAAASAPELGQFGCFQPTSLVLTNGPVVSGTAPLKQTAYTYRLKDQNGASMPGVYVAERWTNASLAANNSAGFVWPSEQSANLVDTFWWDTGAPYTHPYANGNPIGSDDHRYYAATLSAGLYTSSAQTGIKVLQTVTRWFDDFTENY